MKRNLSTARRELRRAVERAAGVDLLPGHLAEARRRAQAVRDAADELIATVERR
jgi:hypothetical protein